MARVSRHSRRRGTAIVEAAIVFPLVVLLTFAVIEYGWVFLKVQQMTNAARHGARLAVTPDATGAEVLNAIHAMMDDAGLSDSGYSCVISPTDIESVGRGETVNVSVSVFSHTVRFTGLPLPLPALLGASVSMAKEGP